MLAVADINPPVKMLPPVMLAVAEIRPPVRILPPVMLPEDTALCMLRLPASRVPNVTTVTTSLAMVTLVARNMLPVLLS